MRINRAARINRNENVVGTDAPELNSGGVENDFEIGRNRHGAEVEIAVDCHLHIMGAGEIDQGSTGGGRDGGIHRRIGGVEFQSDRAADSDDTRLEIEARNTGNASTANHKRACAMIERSDSNGARFEVEMQVGNADFQLVWVAVGTLKRKGSAEGWEAGEGQVGSAGNGKVITIVRPYKQEADVVGVVVGNAHNDGVTGAAYVRACVVEADFDVGDADTYSGGPPERCCGDGDSPRQLGGGGGVNEKRAGPAGNGQGHRARAQGKTQAG